VEDYRGIVFPLQGFNTVASSGRPTVTAPPGVGVGVKPGAERRIGVNEPAAMPRYALLEHTGAPDDPKGCHYDLLLEDGSACRTWRLDQIPIAGGGEQEAVPLAPHRLVWLDQRSAAVSGGRGWARGIAHGTYAGALPAGADDPVEVGLLDGPLQGHLRVARGRCGLEPSATPVPSLPQHPIGAGPTQQHVAGGDHGAAHGDTAGCGQFSYVSEGV